MEKKKLVSSVTNFACQEEKFKINFKDGDCGACTGFSMITFLANLDLQVIHICPTKFQVNWHFDSGEEVQNRFSRWRPGWPALITNWNNFSFLDLQVTLILPTKFQVNWPLSSTDFQDGGCDSHLGFPIGMILAIFDPQIAPILPTKFQSIGLSVLEKKHKIDFLDGCHLGFPIRKMLAIFDLQVSSLFHTKF